jgi:cytochrome b6-f complex iron-sulfur subunit
MSNYHVEPADQSQALTTQALKAIRHEQVQGVSRRELLRGSLAAAVGLWILEISAGTLSFLWPNLSGEFGGEIEIGTLDELKADNSDLPVDEGFPVFVSKAKAFVMLIDPARQQFVPGGDDTGDGTSVNVRALYQRCPHLGCKPNPCLKNFWLECPCHGSRYDRLGQKVAGEQFGPAPRSMDRFATTVTPDGVLVINTGKITLGPLPIALGQPGVIPPKSPTGCIA